MERDIVRMREFCIRKYKLGWSGDRIASELQKPRSTIYDWISRYDEKSDFSNRPTRVKEDCVDECPDDVTNTCNNEGSGNEDSGDEGSGGEESDEEDNEDEDLQQTINQQIETVFSTLSLGGVTNPGDVVFKEYPCEEVSKTCDEWSTCTNQATQYRTCKIREKCGLITGTRTAREEQECPVNTGENTGTQDNKPYEEPQETPKPSGITGAITGLGGFNLGNKKMLMIPAGMLLLILSLLLTLQLGIYQKVMKRLRR